MKFSNLEWQKITIKLTHIWSYLPWTCSCHSTSHISTLNLGILYPKQHRPVKCQQTLIDHRARCHHHSGIWCAWWWWWCFDCRVQFVAFFRCKSWDKVRKNTEMLCAITLRRDWSRQRDKVQRNWSAKVELKISENFGCPAKINHRFHPWKRTVIIAVVVARRHLLFTKCLCKRRRRRERKENSEPEKWATGFRGFSRWSFGRRKWKPVAKCASRCRASFATVCRAGSWGESGGKLIFKNW